MESLPAKAGLYWRRGSRVTPGIMTCNNGRLSFHLADGSAVFDAAFADISAVFTRYSTLKLTIAGVRYLFVTGAYAGALAPSFSNEQITELARGDSANEAVQKFQSGALIFFTSNVLTNVGAITGSVAGRGVGIAGEVVGVVRMFKAQHAAFYLSRAWVEYLQKQGLNIVLKGTTYAASQRVIAAIGIPAILLLVVVVYGVLLLLS